ncbi:exopolysaccharide biosynthesis protein [Vulcaniibacterium gelatinicum]|uniref:exopolysaccharide biosynthesis protein n=1 Tax=Vulcaniibacterium gelatinicum TaxID=2598725 RepID=UPI0011C9D480|nr:exopolysaccharide biosynthesis protein [Vulcaniibacterium gelatinicum]
MADSRRPRLSREAGLRAILDHFAVGDPNELLPLRELMAGLGRRAFGMLLFVAVLPAFIPIPVGGAIAGPLVMLIGVQLLALRRRPWLPQSLARRGPHRHALARFESKLGPVLRRLERVVRPRLPRLLDTRAATVFTGVLLVVLGLLLSLPIPLTNYLFGGLLLLYALALIERDGALMLVAWTGGAAAVVVFGVLSGSLALYAQSLLDRLI